MEVNYLLKDELMFELACRGVFDLQTVVPMRKVLREILSRESKGESSIRLKVPASCIDNPVSEIAVCECKFKSLSVGLSEISEGTDRSNVRRIFTRLSHLLGRVKLIIPTEWDHVERHLKILKDVQDAVACIESMEDITDEDDERISDQDKEVLHKSLGVEALSIIDKIERGGGTTSKDQALRSPFLSLSKVCSSEEGKTSKNANAGQHKSVVGNDPRSSYLQRTSTVDLEATKRKLVPIKDWGIKFNGKGSMSINAFLERIDELKDARNATEEDLYRYAVDLFEDDALIWFRANRDSVSCWEELVDLLLTSFQRPYYEEELMEEIKKRTQSRHESVLIYVSVMQNMFNRLPTKLTDRQKLAILLRNIQPEFQRVVCRDSFSSVSELLQVLRIVEQTKLNCENFQEPRASASVIEPDLAFRRTEVEAITAHPLQGVRASGSMKCWNCRNTGHSFKDCPAEKQRLFCYKCGKFGSTVKKCACSSSGNANSEVKPAEGLPK